VSAVGNGEGARIAGRFPWSGPEHIPARFDPAKIFLKIFLGLRPEKIPPKLFRARKNFPAARFNPVIGPAGFF
jgi:hypothetical protein